MATLVCFFRGVCPLIRDRFPAYPCGEFLFGKLDMRYSGIYEPLLERYLLPFQGDV